MDHTTRLGPLADFWHPSEGLKQIKRLLPDGGLLRCPLLKEEHTFLIDFPPLSSPTGTPFFLLFFCFAPFRKILHMGPHFVS